MSSTRSPLKVRRPPPGPVFSSRLCYSIVGAVTLISGLTIFYSYLFKSFKKVQNGMCTKCPTCPSGFTAAMTGNGLDPDAWLDTVGEQYPPIVPSHYAAVHGIEPFERHDLKPFELHVVPTDDWYDRAKKATDRCDLELTEQTQGAKNGLDDKIVWVSGLFDLKRGEAGNKDFARPLEEYFRRFQVVLDRGFEMVIFIPQIFEKSLKIDRSRVHVIYMDAHELRTYFPYWDRLQAIRTSKLWNDQAVQTGWLSNAPQARLPEYNPLVMSKLMMLRDAAQLNPWGARYHLWMDAGHACAGEQRPDATSMYRRHMASGFFVTHWPYGTTTEVHGLTDKAMHLYMAQAEDPLLIVRGGIFGGDLPHIQCVLRAFIIALHQTLSDGYVGTEECIWAIIHKRLPHLFDSFDNNSLGNHGDNCASFSANNMLEKEIASGSKQRFVSPPVPKYPTWWDAAQASTSGGKGGIALRGPSAQGRGEAQTNALLKNGGIAVRSK